jgi:hypothetical protein
MLNPCNRTKCVSKHGQGAVCGGQQVGQRTGQGCPVGGSKQAGVTHPSVSDEPASNEARNFSVYSPRGHPYVLGCVGQAVLAVEMEIKQGEQGAQIDGGV